MINFTCVDVLDLGRQVDLLAFFFSDWMTVREVLSFFVWYEIGFCLLLRKSEYVYVFIMNAKSCIKTKLYSL